MVKPLLTLLDPAAARAFYRDGHWRGDTFYSLLAHHAEARADAFALRDSTRRLTWAALKRWTDATAASFAEAGLDQGERVSLWLSDRAEAVVAFLAAQRQGLVCNPSLHQNYTAEEILALVRRINAGALIAEANEGGDDVLAEAATVVRRVWRLPAERRSGDGFPDPDAAPAPDAAATTNPDRVCYLAFTSGTTGEPKGVMHSSNTLLANARALVEDWGHGPHTIVLSLSPLSHHIAWVGLAQALVAGAEFVVNDPPPGKSALEWIVETDATYVMGVPTHAMDILAEQKRSGLERLGAVKVFYMAGAPIPRATAEAFLDQGITPQNIYGMTENSSHQYTSPDDDKDTIVATCGRGSAAYEVRIFDKDDPDRALPAGEIGQIGGRGASLMLGYFDNQAATEASFNRDGWFMSGDLGHLDERGFLTIVGRLKDIIIRGGRNIHPARIEDLAVKHPAVERAAAFAVADERLGEKVCLAIIPRGPAPAAEGLLDHLHEAGLSKYDMPEYFIVMAAFPLTASGKILKRELVEMARRGEIEPTAVRFLDRKKLKKPGGRHDR